MGRLEGVLATRSGFMGGEAVDVTFDDRVLSYADLLKQALKLRCANRVIARTEAQEKEARKALGISAPARLVRSDAPIKISERDTHYYLRQKPAWFLLPLTELQATRLNSVLSGAAKPSEAPLSPLQQSLFRKLQALPRRTVNAIQLVPDRTEDGLPAYTLALKEALGKIGK